MASSEATTSQRSVRIQGITAVELSGGGQMVLYTRAGRIVQDFYPWLLLESSVDPNALQNHGIVGIRTLDGPGVFNTLVQFRTWSDFLSAREQLKQAGLSFFALNTPIRQYLTLSGQRLFAGMKYEDLHRMQLDIETLGLDPIPLENRIILISVSDNRGFERVIDGQKLDEGEMLRKLNAFIQWLDPDVIEGHNLFDFDLPYLHQRATLHGVRLEWGRDGSELKISDTLRRYKVGARNPPYRPAYVHGRHIIDTFQQIQRWDTEGKFDSYGLKAVVRDLGLERADRTFVEREDIPTLWREDPDRLMSYALDDVRDVRSLSELVVPVEFYQTQVLPNTFQDVARWGTGEKINALMVRAYLLRGRAIPKPQSSRPYAGGYTELKATGVFEHVVKADVESLYPSIMLTYTIKPSSDHVGVFLSMLERFTRRRLQAKDKLKITWGAEHAYWDGVQAGLKTLINSFYGYLGYARANFNDYDAAARVTAIGQQIIKHIVRELERRRAQVIEIDTDGVYFVRPEGIQDREDEEALIEGISHALPEGVRLTHDGRYVRMISLKAKNYVLLGYDGTRTIKGSSLRSRRDERVFREFIETAAALLAEGATEEVSGQYYEIGRRIIAGDIAISDFARQESVTEKTFESPNLKRLAEAVEGYNIGDKVAVYQRTDGSLAPVEAYQNDEDKDYLLRRLHDTALRFKELYPPDVFDQLFPLLRMGARTKKGERLQLSLFEP